MNRWRQISLVPLLLLAVLLSGCRSTAAVPKIEDITSAELNLGVLVPSGDPLPMPLNSGKAADRAVIEKLLGWLDVAEVVGKGQEPLPTLGQHVVIFHQKNGKSVSVGQARDKEQVLYDIGNGVPFHLKSPDLSQWLLDGWKQDVILGTTTSATSAVQLDMYAASNSVVAGQTIAFTVTFKNGTTTEATLITPCGHPFNLQVNADGQEIDDWLRQTYGGPPACPPGQLRVPPGGSYNTTLSLRFPTPGTFSVYAVTLSGGNLLSNQVTIHAR
jgi:hypothetical protein